VSRNKNKLTYKSLI